jgi:hypothetical protein
MSGGWREGRGWQEHVEGGGRRGRREARASHALDEVMRGTGTPSGQAFLHVYDKTTLQPVRKVGVPTGSIVR